MPLPLGALIGAASSLIGGLINKDEASKANRQQMRIAQQNMQMQEDFAKQGIKWKVKDAISAGIHPLYALGATTHSFAPVSVGLGGPSGMGQAVANMGQDLSRAVDVTRTMPERQNAYDKTVMALNVQRLGLENELLATQIAKTRQAGNGPGLPVATDIAGNPRLFESAAGKTLSTNPKVSDAEIFEQRYGDSELLQTLVGLGVAGADIWSNVKKSEFLKRLGEGVKATNWPRR